MLFSSVFYLVNYTLQLSVFQYRLFYFSLLSGGADGVIGIYDTECKPSLKEFSCQTICTVGR